MIHRSTNVIPSSLINLLFSLPCLINLLIYSTVTGLPDLPIVLAALSTCVVHCVKSIIMRFDCFAILICKLVTLNNRTKSLIIH